MKSDFASKYCSFCPSEEGLIILRRNNFVARMCLNCRVIWCDPLRFNNDFHGSDEQAYLEVSEINSKINENKLILLSTFAPSQRYPRLLEIGCMHGLFLS